tara:strand:+ start:963 stop:2273 length:1311 start_codon:yes stop_codon:yes gene_type:complete
MKHRRNRKSKPHFNLDGPPKGRNLQPIYLIYRYKKDSQGKNVKLMYYTGEKAYRSCWLDIERVKASVRIPEPEAESINNKLRLIEDTVKKAVSQNPSISVGDLKRELDYELGIIPRPKSKEQVTLIEYVKSFIDKSTNHPRTIQKYMTAYKHLKEFEKFLGKSITFDQIKPEFSEKLVNWLYNHTKVKSQNTASKLVQNIKTFVRDAHENGYHNNTAYQSSKFTTPRVKTSKHFLELDELNRLSKHDFKDSKNLEKARDLWLIAAYSGLRYSDFSRLQKKHFKNVDGVEIIEMHTYKGRTTKFDNKVVIPILPELKEIVKKYNYEIPKAYEEQVMNRYIKQVMEKAGINRRVEHTTNINGKSVTTVDSLFNYVTNHTARYTFINIMLNDYDISAQDLRKITGQSLPVLMGYERGDKAKTAIKVHDKVMKAMKSSKN